MFWIYLVSAVIAVLIARWMRKYMALRALFKNMPGETDFRLLTGTMHKLPGNNEEGLAYESENARKYKYFHIMWAGPLLPIVSMYHPDIIKLVLKSQAPKPRGGTFISTFSDMGVRWLGEGLLLTNGKRWTRSRRMLTPAFHFEVLKSYLEIYNKCTHVLIDKLQTVSKTGQSCEIYSTINLYALDVILQCAFSHNSNCQTQDTGDAYTHTISELQSLWSKRTLNPFVLNEFIYSFTAEGKAFYKHCDVAHKVTEDVIEKRRAALAKKEQDPKLTKGSKMKDFLDLLLSAKDADGNGLSPLEMRDEVDTFMFAGHDTAASGMTWTLYALAGHPEHQQRVYEEILEVLGDREDVEWNDLPKLEYTTMCVKEAVRLYSPVPIIERVLSEDLTFNDQTFPKGTRTFVQLYCLHHNPHVWDEPNEYRPERFHPDVQRNMNPFQYVPFSAGSRNCIGQNFAMNEMKTTTAKIIRKFTLSIDPEHKVRRLPTITMVPETGVYLFAIPRS